MTPTALAVEVLERAADLVERPDGWCRHATVKWIDESEQYAYCAIGAICECARSVFADAGLDLERLRTVSGPAITALRRAVNSDVNARARVSIPTWNDEVADGAWEVATKMRHAAKALREEEEEEAG